MTDIEYRRLGTAEVARLAEIDRTEVIEAIYHHRDGELVLEEEHWDLRGWSPEHLDELQGRTRALLGRGGAAWGAFDGDGLVGVAALDVMFIGRDGDTLQMYLLHVSDGYRRRGVGSRLLELSKAMARGMGARWLYVSGLPSENTIGFYTRRGFRVTEEPDPDLLALEPEDIHMVLALDGSD
jgi:ribosomal protein S18 acetylase RimI-like enzyme